MVVIYLISIVVANLLVVKFGAGFSVINALLFIGLEITTRDALHERWQERYLWRNMALLIFTGSALSAMLNINALPIAIASFVSFVVSGTADTIVYAVLGKHEKAIRVNISNITAAAVDSLVFPILAFGFPVLWPIVIAQFLAKTLGGFVWFCMLTKLSDL